MRPVWRLLECGPAGGAWNMAVDRAVQIQREAGESPPTLRLYSWSAPTVTLGHFQPIDGVDGTAAVNGGVEVARRFTGGRGVLHDDELTYSVIASRADGVPRGVSASYRHLCAALVAAYRELGVPAALTARPRGEKGASACYLHATQADVSVGVAKLSGSAQVWMGDTVLQHGSFVIARDVERESELFRLDHSGRDALVKGTATLAERLDVTPTRDTVRNAVVSGFETVLGITLEGGALTEAESELAETLIPEVRVTVL